jgi:Mlc titration factor MtfA (ptsG expression regulator)
MLSLRAWRRQRVLARASLSDELWRGAVARLPLLRGLTDTQEARLRDLAVLFLHEKEIEAAAGLTLTDEVRTVIAAQACLPILELGLDYYDGWRAIIVYPDVFVPEHEYVDEAGVVHVTRRPLMGEAWQQGPVILSASDALHSGDTDGINVVIHELAHKLDMLNGAVNGLPPLHPHMRVAAWARIFSDAYAHFCRRVEAGENTTIDPYAAENPGEFFAVMSEAFFEIPQVLRDEYGELYGQLAAFYRQDPAARLVPRE